MNAVFFEMILDISFLLISSDYCLILQMEAGPSSGTLLLSAIRVKGVPSQKTMIITVIALIAVITYEVT
jgi:hypothetical protein